MPKIVGKKKKRWEKRVIGEESKVFWHNVSLFRLKQRSKPYNYSIVNAVGLNYATSILLSIIVWKNLFDNG